MLGKVMYSTNSIYVMRTSICLPRASRACSMVGSFVPWCGSNIRRTSLTSIFRRRASSLLFTSFSSMVIDSAALIAVCAGTETRCSERRGFEGFGIHRPSSIRPAIASSRQSAASIKQSSIVSDCVWLQGYLGRR